MCGSELWRWKNYIGTNSCGLTSAHENVHLSLYTLKSTFKENWGKTGLRNKAVQPDTVCEMGNYNTISFGSTHKQMHSHFAAEAEIKFCAPF